jgi:hypothetical protein
VRLFGQSRSPSSEIVLLNTGKNDCAVDTLLGSSFSSAAVHFRVLWLHRGSDHS